MNDPLHPTIKSTFGPKFTEQYLRLARNSCGTFGPIENCEFMLRAAVKLLQETKTPPGQFPEVLRALADELDPPRSAA